MAGEHAGQAYIGTRETEWHPTPLLAVMLLMKPRYRRLVPLGGVGGDFSYFEYSDEAR